MQVLDSASANYADFVLSIIIMNIINIFKEFYAVPKNIYMADKIVTFRDTVQRCYEWTCIIKIIIIIIAIIIIGIIIVIKLEPS